MRPVRWNFWETSFPRTRKGIPTRSSFFDAIPKFLFTSQRRRKTIEILVREFHHRGDEYRLALKPAAIETPEGPFLVFPGEREELVLRALRYMAVQQLAASSLWGHQQGHKQMRLAFTLSQLQNVLAEKVPGVDGKLRGHAFKLSEIDEALRVCRGATVSLEFNEAGKKAQHESGILSEYYAVDEETGDGQKSLRCVILHPLATAAILQQEYRSINYRRLMALPSPLARWIYERLSHLFINAEKRRAWADGMRPPKGFTLDLETVLNESGVLRRKRFRENITEVRSALHELSMAGVLVPLPKGATAGTGGPYVEKTRLRRKPRWATPGHRCHVDVVPFRFARAGNHRGKHRETRPATTASRWRERAAKVWRVEGFSRESRVLNWFRSTRIGGRNEPRKFGVHQWRESAAKVGGDSRESSLCREGWTAKVEGLVSESLVAGRDQPRK